MKNITSRELIKIIENDGWRLVAIVGSHHQFKHPSKSGKVTIPHPKKELAPKTIKTILKQAELL
ncbi:type II toxin-antitoxin system HicA family toxin [Paenibacillus yanchengensis]|uniref:Type II toxin-antitoxin system HicA family toxin n=1 Tax=Paenibacillus yanchengensis TaxID=2035833 RepID=A0ABW4YFK8_9BACL